MTPDGFRDPLPATDDAARARIELEGLFARDQPAVKVLIKKRRRPAAQGSEAGGAALAQTRDQTLPPAADASPTHGSDARAHGPRVHRLRAPAAGPATGMPAAPASTNGHGGGMDDLRPARARRARMPRDPSRRPSPVHVVVQAPPKPAVSAEQPAWRRILCVAPEEVSYLEVVQALRQVQTLLEQARHASRLQLAAGAG